VGSGHISCRPISATTPIQSCGATGDRSTGPLTHSNNGTAATRTPSWCPHPQQEAPMPANAHLTITVTKGAWEVCRPDGYRLVFEQVDTAQARSWRAQVTSFIHDTELLTASIDLLNLRDRAMYHETVAAMNGQHPCAWDQFLMQGYRGIQDLLAATAPREPWP